MSIWPYLPVWPFLLGIAAISAFWNWRCALAVTICVCLVQFLTMREFPLGQFYFLAIYTCIGALSFFLFDKIAGAALCLVGLAFVAHIIGLIGHYPKVIASEAFLVVGLVLGAFIGPSGGILDFRGSIVRGGSDDLDLRGSIHRKAHSSLDEKAPLD